MFYKSLNVLALVLIIKKGGALIKKNAFFKGDYFLCTVFNTFIYRQSDSTVSVDAGIEHRTVATTALTVRRSNHSAKSHPLPVLG